MVSLLALPFDVHLIIVKYLSLKDCLAYMQVSTVTHDLVYYVFSHRKELNFASVFDHNKTIALFSRILMEVLYAHPRVNTITNFCFNSSFNLYDDFSRYFNLYFRRRWVDLDWPYGTCQMMVGHPAGNLLYVYYLGTHNGGANQQQSTFLQSLWLGLHDWITPKVQPVSSIEPKQNWSTIDIDKPYVYSVLVNYCTCPACTQPEL